MISEEKQKKQTTEVLIDGIVQAIKEYDREQKEKLSSVLFKITMEIDSLTKSNGIDWGF